MNWSIQINSKQDNNAITRFFFIQKNQNFLNVFLIKKTLIKTNHSLKKISLDLEIYISIVKIVFIKNSNMKNKYKNQGATPSKKFKTIFTVFIIIFFLIIFIVCIILWISQKYMFFHPRNDTTSYVQLQKNSDFEEVNIVSEGKNLNWWMYYNNTKWKKSPLVIYFGGNAQNSSNTMSYFLNQWIFDYFEWYNVLMIDYPEYGYSEWSIWENAMFKAAKDIYNWAINQPDVDADNIIIIGYSIWTGVASYCASINKVKGLILIAPYDKALSLYNNAINIFHGPIKLLARYKFDSHSYSKDIDTEVQVITSYDDEVINYTLSQNLSNRFKNHKDIIILDNNVGHNDYFSQNVVLNTIKEYLYERL